MYEEKLAKTIVDRIHAKHDPVACGDLFSLCREWEETDFQKAHDTNKWLKNICVSELSGNAADKFYEQWRRCLLFDAPHDFDSYLTYIELDREAKKRFYPPRRKVLKQVVDDLQDMMVNDKLDLLAISLPPGTGKSTLAIFLLTFLAGRDPNNPILTGSHSNAFVRGCYDEVLRVLDPNGEYLFHDVFPAVKVTGTNAKDCRIDLDKRQRFETLEFTSIGTGNAGLYRAATLLYCDDLVSGIEVALSKDRLDKL